MSFLQPALLFALPLIALPIIIHLIHRQQHKTVKWAAMLFLLDAKKMTKGMAKLRQWLILLMRTLVVAGLVLMLSRPIAGLWLGNLAGSSTDTTIILFDRSVSMEQKGPDAQLSKRQTALLKLSELLDNLSQNTNILFFDSARMVETEVPSPQALTTLVNAEATSTAGNIPLLIENAMDYIEINQTGQTDVWICSDLQKSDWSPTSPRWESIRSRIQEQKALRLFLLLYPENPEDDFAVTVSQARLHTINNKSQLLLDADIRRNTTKENQAMMLPLQIVIDGKRTVHNVEIESKQYSLQAHPVPLQGNIENGWGKVEVPADDNPNNNVANFLISKAPVQKTVVVSDDVNFAKLIEIAATSPQDPYLDYSLEHLTVSQAHQIDWDTTALLCWQAAIPTGIMAQQMQNYVNSGGSILFFPPSNPNPANGIFGVNWQDWDDGPDSVDSLRNWRTDSGILRNTQDGKALPVGKLKIYRNCPYSGEFTNLATLESGQPLLSQALTNDGNVWFCGTLPQSSHSTLSQEGIVFYILLHRGIEEGAKQLGNARMHSAGLDAPKLDHHWKDLDGSAHPISQRDIQAGIYNSEDEWLAINRPETEDLNEKVSTDILESLMEGLPYQYIQDEAGSEDSITSEIWRLFVYLMAIAALVEALLCIPKLQTQRKESIPSAA